MRKLVAVLTIAALTFFQAGLAFSAGEAGATSTAAAPTQEMPCAMTSSSIPEAVPTDDAEAPAKPACPMMQGALCLSSCAVPAPAMIAGPVDQETCVVHAAFRSAAALPHIAAPPQRPPNRL